MKTANDRHGCVNTFPLESWRKALADKSDDDLSDWPKSVEARSRHLLKHAFYRTYYRLCRQELARRGLRP